MPLHGEVIKVLKLSRDAHHSNMLSSKRNTAYHRKMWRELKTTLDSGTLTPYARKVVAEEATFLKGIIPRGRLGIGAKLNEFNRERLARYKILRKALAVKKP